MADQPDCDPLSDYPARHPLRVAAVIRLARKYKPEALAELGERLDRLGFVGRPGFMSTVRWGPNRPEESAARWLALSRAERQRYHEKDHDYLPAVWIADSLTELVRRGLRSGEITFINGPDAAIDTLELHDGGILSALRVEFAADTVPPAEPATEPLDRGIPSEPERAEPSPPSEALPVAANPTDDPKKKHQRNGVPQTVWGDIRTAVRRHLKDEGLPQERGELAELERFIANLVQQEHPERERPAESTVRRRAHLYIADFKQRPPSA